MKTIDAIAALGFAALAFTSFGTAMGALPEIVPPDHVSTGLLQAAIAVSAAGRLVRP